MNYMHHCRFKAAILTILMITGSTCLSYGQLSPLYKQFKNPPTQYRPVPFWHLNGVLATTEINKQITEAINNGFGGVAVLPVTAGPQHPTNKPSPGMKPAYLSEDYFARYADILKAAKDNKGQVILYDDIDFPSGTAGGKLKLQYPDYTRKVLEKTDTVLRGGQQVKLKVPSGQLMAAVAMNIDNRDRINVIDKILNGELVCTLPSGNWKVMLFTCNATDGIVDYMNPEAVNKFITLTYNEYAKRFGSYFGNVVKQTFFDDVGYVFMERGWTSAFNEKFKQRFGKDPALYYPALWEDIGSETEAARVAFFDTRAELMAEGFPKSIYNWTKEHGLKSSGHPPGNYEIQPVDMNFDIFKFNRYPDIPTMDAIFYHGHGREGYKLVSSASAGYDRTVTAAEIYGAFEEDSFTVNTLYQVAMEVFVRGINFLIPHGMWYDPSPQSVRIPPLISPYSAKLQPSLQAFNDFAARTSMMLTGGKQVAEIGIIYPIASLEAFYHFEAKDNKSVGKFVPLGTDYLEVGNMLTNTVHRDFTFIHPELFSGEKYKVVDSQILLNNKINTQTYKVIIIPGGKVISYHTLKKINQFYQEGGKVIATSVLPSKSAEFNMDTAVTRLVNEIFYSKRSSIDGAFQKNKKGGIALFIEKPNAVSLASALNEMDGRPDILMENNVAPDSGNGAFSYLHKINDGRNIYYFANSSNDSINTIVNIRGKLKLEFWDPKLGSKNKITGLIYKSINGVTYTSIPIKLMPVSSIFVVSAD